jgi:hypothetical protein
MSEWLDKAIDKGKDAAREAEVKVRDAVEEHADQIKGGIEKAAGFVHDKTKGRFGDSVGKVEEAAKGLVDKLGSAKGEGGAEGAADGTSGTSGTSGTGGTNASGGETVAPTATDDGVSASPDTGTYDPPPAGGAGEAGDSDPPVAPI